MITATENSINLSQTMYKYKIEVIQDECIGYKKCGLCMGACEEHILIPDYESGKVKVNKETELYCDGIGSCLSVCPVNALKIIKEKIEVGTNEVKMNIITPLDAPTPCGCPSSMAKTIDRIEIVTKDEDTTQEFEPKSELTNWPVQLHLLNPMAPYFKNSELVIAADCCSFAYANFHKKFLKGKKVLAIGCPKLDDASKYTEKIRSIVKFNNIKKVTVVIMSVPCCAGMYSLVKNALDGLDCELIKHVVSVDGTLMDDSNAQTNKKPQLVMPLL